MQVNGFLCVFYVTKLLHVLINEGYKKMSNSLKNDLIKWYKKCVYYNIIFILNLKHSFSLIKKGLFIESEYKMAT